jgi:synaptosomal-associated protein 23
MQDDNVAELSRGIGQLKNIAIDMGNELDRQDEQISRIDKKADDNLDHVDNLNVSMKKALTGVIFALI